MYIVIKNIEERIKIKKIVTFLNCDLRKLEIVVRNLIVTMLLSVSYAYIFE